MNIRTEKIADATTELAHRSVDKIADAASSIETGLRAGADCMRSGAEKSASQARQLVDANPLSSIALAALVGGLLVWLIKR